MGLAGGARAATRQDAAADESSAPLDMVVFCRDEHPKLVGALTLYTGDRDLAEELAQDVIVRVITHWKQVAGADSPSAWTHRVGVNLANSWFRRTMAGRRAVDRMQQRPVALDSVANDGSALALREALAKLPPRQRTALVLRYYADLPASEVAQIMGCADGTVWALVHQAVATLRKTPGFETLEASDV